MHARLTVDTLTELWEPLAGEPRPESRRHVREGQQPELLARWLRADEIVEAPTAPRCAPGFAYASADFMPVRDRRGSLRFHLLELNGCGTRGISNLPPPLQEALYAGVAEAAGDIAANRPLVLFPFRAGSPSGLRYERALLAQALATGLEPRHGQARVVWTPRPAPLPGGATIAVASSDDLRRALSARSGQLWLGERRVAAAFHDIFVQHLLDRFEGEVGEDGFLPINPSFRVSADKAATYPLFDAFLGAPDPPAGDPRGRHLLGRTGFEIAGSREALLTIVRRRAERGVASVIKPRAAGLARGIAFFPVPSTEDEIVARVDASLASVTFATPADQPLRRAFPYAVCDLLEGATIRDPAHPLFGHRFEVRIMLYRQGGRIRAFPSIAKVSGQRYRAAGVSEAMLLNTVALSAAQAPLRPNEHALPLANTGTLEALGIELADLEQLCAQAVAFVGFIGRRAAGGGSAGLDGNQD